MEKLAARLWQEQEGQALTEYALLLVLVSLVAVSAMKNFASTVNDVYSRAASEIAGCEISTQTKNDYQSAHRLKESSSHPHWDWHYRTHGKVKNDIK